MIFLSLIQSKDGPQGENSGLDPKLIMASVQAINTESKQKKCWALDRNKSSNISKVKQM